jgi:hypothetical protein
VASTGDGAFRIGLQDLYGLPFDGGTQHWVTCDGSGRVVDFAIQEGKGDSRSRILALGFKWREEIVAFPVMVFDREGHGEGFFSSSSM